jgi:hypothetical protein
MKSVDSVGRRATSYNRHKSDAFRDRGYGTLEYRSSAVSGCRFNDCVICVKCDVEAVD